MLSESDLGFQIMYELHAERQQFAQIHADRFWPARAGDGPESPPLLSASYPVD